MAIRFAPLTTSVGTSVEGVDLRDPLDRASAEALRAELARRGVLVFRNQHLDTEQQKAVALAFGPLEPSPSRKMFGLDDPVRFIQREIFAARDDGATPQTYQRSEEFQAWHVDDTFCPEIPDVATLRPEALSPAGGDTCWANMAAAFASLSPMMQGWLEELTGIHEAPANFRATVNYSALSTKEQQRFEEQSVGRHPLVIEHPVSGQHILFANPTYTTGIEGLSGRESRMLLRFLFNEASRPDFIYRHHWEMGDLVMWDELTTMHLGPEDFPAERRLVRIYAGLTKPTAVSRRSTQDRPHSAAARV
jgi:taurine dioxygenase